MRKQQLFHSRNHCINVLARIAAKNAVKEQLRDQGVRLTLVPIREINEKAIAYLADHPELYQEALERAKALGYVQTLPIMVTPDPTLANQITPKRPLKRLKKKCNQWAIEQVAEC